MERCITARSASAATFHIHEKRIFNTLGMVVVTSSNQDRRGGGRIMILHYNDKTHNARSSNDDDGRLSYKNSTNSLFDTKIIRIAYFCLFYVSIFYNLQ